MAFLTLNEKGIGIECVVFPKIYEMCKNIIVDNVVVVEGKFNSRDDKLALIIDKYFQLKQYLT